MERFLLAAYFRNPGIHLGGEFRRDRPSLACVLLDYSLLLRLGFGACLLFGDGFLGDGGPHCPLTSKDSVVGWARPLAIEDRPIEPGALVCRSGLGCCLRLRLRRVSSLLAREGGRLSLGGVGDDVLPRPGERWVVRNAGLSLAFVTGVDALIESAVRVGALVHGAPVGLEGEES